MLILHFDPFQTLETGGLVILGNVLSAKGRSWSLSKDFILTTFHSSWIAE